MPPLIRWANLGLLATAIVGLGLALAVWLPGARWPHEPVHSTVEAAGTFAALTVAGLVAMLVRRGKMASPCVWVAAGLIGLGLLDGFHALSHVGNTFVWLHSFGTLVGGCLFAMVWLPAPTRVEATLRLVVTVVAVSTLLAGLASLWFPEAVPTMLHDGDFTPAAEALNLAGGLGFFAAAFYFQASGHAVDARDRTLLSVHCLLFGAAGLTFPLSSAWDAVWWYWHLVRLFAYLVALTFFFDRYGRTERALRDSEAALASAKERAETANAAKSRFLAAASHDMRQPLQAITLFVSVGLSRCTEPGTAEILDRIRGAAQGLADLLNALLDLSRLEAGQVAAQLTDFPAASLFCGLTHEFEAMATAKGLCLTAVPSTAVVRSDPTLLSAIVRNLLANAIRYTDHGRVLLGCRRRGRDLRIDVHDTGPGIAADRLALIFEEFYQVGNVARDRREGFGLGLAIVDRLARLLGHRVDVASTVGKGSRFSITVPMAAESLRSGRSRPDGTIDDAVGAVVAVIEDEADVRDSLRLLLGQWGYTVIAGDDEDCVLRAIGDRPPDLVLADYRLRGGRTGIEAIGAIRRKAGADIPGLLLTGDTGLDRERDGLRVLRKPIAVGQLRRIVATALGYK